MQISVADSEAGENERAKLYRCSLLTTTIEKQERKSSVSCCLKRGHLGASPTAIREQFLASPTQSLRGRESALVYWQYVLAHKLTSAATNREGKRRGLLPIFPQARLEFSSY